MSFYLVYNEIYNPRIIIIPQQPLPATDQNNTKNQHGGQVLSTMRMRGGWATMTKSSNLRQQKHDETPNVRFRRCWSSYPSDFKP